MMNHDQRMQQFRDDGDQLLAEIHRRIDDGRIELPPRAVVRGRALGRLFDIAYGRGSHGTASVAAADVLRELVDAEPGLAELLLAEWERAGALVGEPKRNKDGGWSVRIRSRRGERS